MVYCELGRLPLNATRKIRVINYWSKLLSTDNCILKQCYKQLLQDISICKNWLCDVRDILYSLGFNYVWRLQKIDVNFANCKPTYLLPGKTINFSKQQEMTKCRIYKHLIDGVYLQYHLRKAIPKKCMKYLTKFRLSSPSTSSRNWTISWCTV